MRIPQPTYKGKSRIQLDMDCLYGHWPLKVVNSARERGREKVRGGSCYQLSRHHVGRKSSPCMIYINDSATFYNSRQNTHFLLIFQMTASGYLLWQNTTLEVFNNRDASGMCFLQASFHALLCLFCCGTAWNAENFAKYVAFLWSETIHQSFGLEGKLIWQDEKWERSSKVPLWGVRKRSKILISAQLVFIQILQSPHMLQLHYEQSSYSTDTRNLSHPLSPWCITAWIIRLPMCSSLYSPSLCEYLMHSVATYEGKLAFKYSAFVGWFWMCKRIKWDSMYFVYLYFMVANKSAPGH